MNRFAAYTIVGGLGFVVDAAILTLLVAAGNENPLVARCLSFPPAVLTTWVLNRRMVFTSSARSVGEHANEYGRYFSVQLVGAFINLGVYTMTLAYFPTLRPWPVIALVAGSLIALSFNFLGARLWVFYRQV